MDQLYDVKDDFLEGAQKIGEVVFGKQGEVGRRYVQGLYDRKLLNSLIMFNGRISGSKRRIIKEVEDLLNADGLVR